MRKIASKLLLISLAVISISATVCYDTTPYFRSSSYPVALNPISKTVEVINDMDSFDARDEFNRPVKTVQAKQELKSLFLSGFYTLLVLTETRYSFEIVSFIQKAVAAARAVISRGGYVITKFVQAVHQFLRKLVPIRAILFVSVFCLLAMHACSYLFFTPKVKVAPLILRC